MTRKRKWRTRTRGTPSQIGNRFVPDSESQQFKKANLPTVEGESTARRVSRMFAIKSKEERALKELRKRKQEQKYLFGQPVEYQSDSEPDEDDVDEQIREEAQEVKKVVMEINYDTKNNFRKFADWFRQTRIGQWLERKKEERESQLRKT